MACKHVWIGSTSGVTCAVCGKQLTHEEYVALLEKQKKVQKPE